MGAADTNSVPTAVDGEPDVKLNRKTVFVIFAALVAAMFPSSLDQSVVSTALPTIAGDLYGRHWPFLIAISIFVIGSTDSALPGSFTELVTWRVLLGLGAGGLMGHGREAGRKTKNSRSTSWRRPTRGQRQKH